MGKKKNFPITVVDIMNLVGSLLGGMTESTVASMLQMKANDKQNAQSIYTAIAADAQKSQMNRWKILQDTQTKIFEIQQDVTVNRAKTQDKMFGKWDEYIRS